MSRPVRAMRGTDPDAGGRNGQGLPAPGVARSGDVRPPRWLLGQRLAVPERVAGHLERTALVERAMPTRRGLTVLQAPGGFGKTTLLAECCRRLMDEGVRIAWVSLDEQDEPGVLDTYIAYACECAAAGARAGPDRPGVADLGTAAGGTGSRTALAAHAIADLDAAFVLVFDEVERLANPQSAALLEFLLQRGPPNLHLAFAGRLLPPGVNVAGAVLDGRAAIFSAEDLRFTRKEVAAFFDGKLTQKLLSAVMTESAGWPFALRVSRNEMASGPRGGALSTQAFVENWVDARLFAGLGTEEREFLLDIGLFEWIDAALLDEVLERGDSMHRIGTMPVLVGMLEPVRDGDKEIWRLHPLIREHCIRQRFRDTPQRFRTIHRRIADALERRGQTVGAMRHAVEAGEPGLAGEMLERAGGVLLEVRIGPAQFLAADRLLSEDVIGARPRLALVRSFALMLSGRMEEAGERYRSTAAILEGLEADGSADAVRLAAESCVVRGMIVLYSGERFGSATIRTHLADVARLAQSPALDNLTRGIMEYSLCLAGAMTARFPDALDHAARARQCVADVRYMSMHVDLLGGQIAMAEGRAEDAGALYHRAKRFATSSYVLGPEPAAICRVLLQELALECGVAATDAELTHMPEALASGGSPLQVYAAASSALIELRLRDEGVEGALAAAEEMLAYVREARLPALERHVSALVVSVLAVAGRIADGERAWSSAGLPEAAAGCLDLEGQTWREMESLCSARLRLAMGGGRFDEARRLAGDLRALAAERGLRRTLMRALALSMVLELRAGDDGAAAAHLGAYLWLYAHTPYAGPLVREREECVPAVAAFVEAGPDCGVDEAARLLLAAMQRADAPGRVALNAREVDVLRRLATQRDKQIAADLNLSTYGVRHHIRKLFAKLGVRRRGEAVRRARELGLFADER